MFNIHMCVIQWIETTSRFCYLLHLQCQTLGHITGHNTLSLLPYMYRFSMSMLYMWTTKYQKVDGSTQIMCIPYHPFIENTSTWLYTYIKLIIIQGIHKIRVQQFGL